MSVQQPVSPILPNRLDRDRSRGVYSERLTSLPKVLALIGGDIGSVLLVYVLSDNFLVNEARIGPKTMLVWLCVWLVWRAYQGLYPGYGRSAQTELRLHTIGTYQIAVVQVAAAFALQRTPSSTLGVLVEWAFVLPLSLLVRYLVRGVLIRTGQYGRSISIIGAGHTGSLITAYLQVNPSYGLKPVALYDDNSMLHGKVIYGVPVIGSIGLALAEPQTEQAIISIPGARAEIQKRVVNTVYSKFPITWVVPDLFGVPNQALTPHSIGTVASLEIRNNLRSVRSQIVKRMMDIVGALLCSVLLLPVLLIIALVIRLDSPGPIVYRACRLGRNGRPFGCFKFRSMYHEAEDHLHSLLAKDPQLLKEYETFHKLKDDPRITRIGQFLRKFSLDELPQIFNVLRGEMSLVGPRPYLLREQAKMGIMADLVTQVRPGMTGYWQVSGRNSSTFEERVDMDRFYITNWSLWLDAVILLQTARAVLSGKGAY